MNIPDRLTLDQYMLPTDALRVFHQFLDADVDIHYHDFYEVHVVLSGKATHVLNGRKCDLKPGSAFLLTPVDFHSLHIEEPLESYNVIFSDSILPEDIYSYVFNANRNYVVEFDAFDFCHIRAYCDRLWWEYSHHQSGFSLATRRLLELLLVELARAGTSTEPEILSRDDSRVLIQKALTYLRHHFREDVSLEDLARQVQLSTNYFSNRFHAITGITFQKYLQELRLSFAANLLCMSNIPITEISSAAGFGSLSHFERAFRLKYERSPKSYRSACAISQSGSPAKKSYNL